MCRLRFGLWVTVFAICGALACSRGNSVPTVPSTVAPSAGTSAAAGPSSAAALAAQPPFNLEAILRGDGFGLVKFRQQKDPSTNIINLDVWVRDLGANSSYSLQRAVDTVLDDDCTGTNWLTLGLGPAAQPIVTDDRGTGRADLWRDLSTFAPGTAFDIHFRVVETGTSNVVLQSDCYRFVVRD
jgi:hypothetical protein